MFDHITEKHNHVQIDKLTDFKFEVVKGFRDPLTRQITEAIRIGQGQNGKFYNPEAKGQNIYNLNRKSEVFAPREKCVKEKQYLVYLYKVYDFGVFPNETSTMTIIIYLAKNLSRKTGVSRIMLKMQ